MKFVDAMKVLMQERGMNSKRLSEASGVSTQYISKLMVGKVLDPTWPKACKIIDALGVTTDEFRAIMERDES